MEEKKYKKMWKTPFKFILAAKKYMFEMSGIASTVKQKFSVKNKPTKEKRRENTFFLFIYSLLLLL